MVTALKADGDSGGHRGGLLHDALAAALAARPRDAAACRRAMVHWLQRGVACAHALGEELAEVAASAPQLKSIVMPLLDETSPCECRAARSN